mmetsp:Transcript_11136/g.33374  ORF Transcript_11136/g.33374 Transcript_11136/m.33374 type:complete len:309 (+) Transcript_11136:1244-2170(+)
MTCWLRISSSCCWMGRSSSDLGYSSVSDWTGRFETGSCGGRHDADARNKTYQHLPPLFFILFLFSDFSSFVVVECIGGVCRLSRGPSSGGGRTTGILDTTRKAQQDRRGRSRRSAAEEGGARFVVVRSFVRSGRKRKKEGQRQAAGVVRCETRAKEEAKPREFARRCGEEELGVEGVVPGGGRVVGEFDDFGLGLEDGAGSRALAVLRDVAGTFVERERVAHGLEFPALRRRQLPREQRNHRIHPLQQRGSAVGDGCEADGREELHRVRLEGGEQEGVAVLGRVRTKLPPTYNETSTEGLKSHEPRYT